MRKVVIHFAIVVYPSEHGDIGKFTAHCLNLDIIADDDSEEGAVSKLFATVEDHLDAAAEYGADPIKIAPPEYWEKLKFGKSLPTELIERIVSNANSRRGVDAIESQQVEIRELQTA